MNSNQVQPQWRDATNYTREETERGERWARAYRLRLGPVTVAITSDNIYIKGKWVLVCPQLDLGTAENPRKLQATTATEAQSEALTLVTAQVRQLVAALAALNQTGQTGE
jgi:hypothetical protein